VIATVKYYNKNYWISRPEKIAMFMIRHTVAFKPKYPKFSEEQEFLRAQKNSLPFQR
jgi:hypothetical protein